MCVCVSEAAADVGHYPLLFPGGLYSRRGQKGRSWIEGLGAGVGMGMGNMEGVVEGMRRR